MSEKEEVRGSVYGRTSKIRTAVIAENPKPRKVEPVLDKLLAEKKIIEFLTNIENIQFIPHKSAARDDLQAVSNPKRGAVQEVGYLWQTFSLSKLRKFLGLFECNDDFILSLLDSLSVARKAKFFSARIPEWNPGFDVRFKVEIGRAVREHNRQFRDPQIVKTIFHDDKPQTKIEFEHGPKNFLPSEKIAELREGKKKFLESRFGKVDFDLEKKLRYQDGLEKSRFRRAILKLADEAEKKT